MFSDDRSGCLLWACVGIAFLLGLYVMGAGGSTSTTPSGSGSTTNTTTTTTNVQVNILSAVNNGRVLSNDTNTTQNTASGDRAVIYDAGNTPMCFDANSQTFTYAACGVRP